MKTAKIIAAEQIAFEEVTEEFVALKLHDEKFVIDMDTLYDLAFRSAAFLAFLEERELERGEGPEREGVCLCSDLKLH
ncbi:MAG: hypothetical protein HUU57_06885 [Bdellovibrio sp.]|nr:hypothetical protein [Bdellovibrio sp.]